MRHHRRTTVLFPAVLVAAAVLVTGCTPRPAEGSSTSTTDTSTAPKQETVEVATELQFSGDGSVSWIDAKLATSATGEPNVEPVKNGTRRSARVATDAVLLTPEGCVPPFGDVKIDEDGLGETLCSWEKFVETDHFAPKIWFDEDGEISKIASRYHP